MRFVLNILTAVVVLGIFVVATTIYLAPNDIAKCKTPGVYSDSSQTTCQKVDTVVAISGGNTSQRTNHAVKLFKAGWADKLIFSGAAADTSSPSNANVMKSQARSMGVASGDILMEEDAQNTKDNANLTKQIILDNNIKSIILTTSGYHQRRAFLEFENSLKDTGVKILNSPTEDDSDWSFWWWLNPRSWRLVISEYIGIAVFYASLGGR